MQLLIAATLALMSPSSPATADCCCICQILSTQAGMLTAGAEHEQCPGASTHSTEAAGCGTDTSSLGSGARLLGIWSGSAVRSG